MWTLDRTAELPRWKPDPPFPGVELSFSTRLGGVSAPPYQSLNLGRSTADGPEAVTENRRRFLAALELSPDRLATAGQVHGARIVEVSEPGHAPECDALLTRARGLALAVTTADCMPLIYVAPDAIAVAHAGWRGTADRMPSVALEAVCRAAGCGPSSVRVHLGPCIRSCCYEVGAEVAERFPSPVSRPWGERFRLDLPLAARIQLTEAGLPPDSLHDLEACTACEPFFYFSHRRDGSPAGRHWAAAALRVREL